MNWLQCSVEVSRERVEDVEDFFASAGALSVTAMDAGDEPLLEPSPGETPLWQAVRVVALFEAGLDIEDLRSRFALCLPALQFRLQVESLADRDWSETWRETFGPMRFGERLWIVPTGEDLPDAGAVVIRLDPGLAFGTGTHPTTALCLAWLDAHPPRGQTVIDYGCGSGVLAIAAHRLGAAQVHAIDIDPQALTATRENARRNAIDAGLTVALPEDLAVAQADLLIANILANPLIELAGRLTGLLAPGGNIIMTGILATQAGEVMAAYADAIDFDEPVQREEWVLLAGRKR